MLTCSCRSLRKNLWKFSENHVRLTNASQQGFSAARRPYSKADKDLISPRHEALTLLHKVSKVLPLALGTSLQTSHWDVILSRIHRSLSTTEERPVKLVVCGLDEWSGSHEFLTALLSDPLSSNEDVTRVLNERWTHSSQDHLHITYGPGSLSNGASLVIPSTFLTQFPVPIEISEFRPTVSLKSVPISQILEHHAISEADIPIFLCNPLATPISIIPMTRLPSNSIIVFSSSVEQGHLDMILKQLSPKRSPTRSSVRFLSVDPKRALNAINILQKVSNSALAIQRYQDDILGSQISWVIEVLHSKLQNDEDSPASPILTKLALGQIEDALNAACASLQAARQDLDHAFVDASNLRKDIEETIIKTQSNIFERRDETENEVVIAIGEAQKDMLQVLNSLTWWRMIWRIDEISNSVATAVSRSWCRNLEKKLTLETGKLTAVQSNLSKSAFQLLSRHAIIQTAVLQNEISQLESSPKNRLSPQSLTHPIHSRLRQIIQYPTSRLHLAGQRVVLGMVGGSITGVGISWAGWFGLLLGNGEGMISSLALNASTTIGVGMLIAVASIRWGVASWEKAKKRWWQDWTRVGEGLERDLKVTLDRTLHQQVTVVAATACNGISAAVKRREEEMAVVGKELDVLHTTLESILAKVTPTKMT